MTYQWTVPDVHIKTFLRKIVIMNNPSYCSVLKSVHSNTDGTHVFMSEFLRPTLHNERI